MSKNATMQGLYNVGIVPLVSMTTEIWELEAGI